MNALSQSDLLIGILDEKRGIASALLRQQPNCTIRMLVRSSALQHSSLTLQVGFQFRSFSNIELDLGFVQFWYIGLICWLPYLLSRHSPPAVTRCFASHKCTFLFSAQVFDCRCRGVTRSNWAFSLAIDVGQVVIRPLLERRLHGWKF